MAKIKAVDQAVVITSSLTNEQIARAEKYFPEALEVKEKDENGKSRPVFCVASGEACVTTRGIQFPSTTATKKEFASVTVQIPKFSKEKRVEYVKDNFGPVLVKLNVVEKQYADRENAFNKEYANLDKDIEIE